MKFKIFFFILEESVVNIVDSALEGTMIERYSLLPMLKCTLEHSHTQTNTRTHAHTMSTLLFST